MPTEYLYGDDADRAGKKSIVEDQILFSVTRTRGGKHLLFMVTDAFVDVLKDVGPEQVKEYVCRKINEVYTRVMEKPS